MPSPLDCRRQLALMAETIARNPPRDDAPALRQKIAQESDVLKINGAFFNTKPTRPAPLEKASASSATAVTSSTTASAFAFHNLPHQLLRFFIFVRSIFMHGGIAAGRLTTSAVAAFWQERDRLRNDFVLAALLSVLRFPTPLLEPP